MTVIYYLHHKIINKSKLMSKKYESFNFLFLFIEKNLLSSNFYLIDKLLYK